MLPVKDPLRRQKQAKDTLSDHSRTILLRSFLLPLVVTLQDHLRRTPNTNA